MDISFIILFYYSEKYLCRCIKSIVNNDIAGRFRYEIFIVDNGSQDRSVAIIKYFKRLYPDKILPIFLERNYGTTYSRNLALKQAGGEYLAILDSDIEIQNDCVEKLVHILKNDHTIGLVSPKLIYNDGKLQKSTDNFPTLQSKLKRFFFLKRIEAKTEDSGGKGEVDYAISAMWIMKRELLNKVGYLDENIFYAPEDADFCLSIWKAGYKVVYIPDALVIHSAREMSRGLKINKQKLAHIKGLVYYFSKHKYCFKKPYVTSDK